MIHTLHIPCPQCGTLLVDFDGPDCSFDRNWGCLHCSAAWDGYGTVKHSMAVESIQVEDEAILQDFLDAVKMFDGMDYAEMVDFFNGDDDDENN